MDTKCISTEENTAKWFVEKTCRFQQVLSLVKDNPRLVLLFNITCCREHILVMVRLVFLMCFLRSGHTDLMRWHKIAAYPHLPWKCPLFVSDVCVYWNVISPLHIAHYSHRGHSAPRPQHIVLITVWAWWLGLGITMWAQWSVWRLSRPVMIGW